MNDRDLGNHPTTRSGLTLSQVRDVFASPSGAQTQAVLMTVLRTLKRRGHNPLVALTRAVSHDAATGELPPFPPKIASGG